MLRIGKTYLGTKYVANTLDQGTEEKLVILPQTVDCLTFVEYTLAQAMGSSFADNLQKIRYRDGVIDGYTSRLHYTSDWIENGVRQGFLEDVTAQNSTQTTKLSLSYMSTHPKQYRQLAEYRMSLAVRWRRVPFVLRSDFRQEALFSNRHEYFASW